MILSINLPDQPLNLKLDKGQELFFLAEKAKAEGEAYAKEKAKWEALKQVYTIEELMIRLKRGRSSIINLIHNNRIRYTTVGDSKGYLVSEKAVLEFLGDLEPEA